MPEYEGTNEIVPVSETSPVAIERKKIWKYLPRAIERMGEAMESENEKIAVGASKFIIEQCLGRAIQHITGDSVDDNEAARQFAAALKLAMADKKTNEVQLPIIEGGVRILGNPIDETNTGGVLNSDAALGDFEE